METFAQVASTGTDSVKIQDHEILSPFVEPSTAKTFVDCGFTRLYSRDALSNSTGSFFFEYERELLPKVHDLSTLICEVTTSIVRVEGNEERPVELADNVSVTNNFVDSLWSKIHMTINNAEAYSSPANRYHYVQLSRLLGHQEPLEEKGLDLLATCQVDEDPGSTDPTLNPGFNQRAQMFVKRKRDSNAKYQIDHDAQRLKDRESLSADAILAAFRKNQKEHQQGKKRKKSNDGDEGESQSQLPSENGEEGGKSDSEDDGNSVSDFSSVSDGSKRVYSLGTLTYGFNTTKQFLPWNCSLQIQLDKESDEHILYVRSSSTEEARKFKLKIHNVGLYLRYYLINDQLYNKFKAIYQSGIRSKMYFLKPYTHSNLMEIGTRHFSKDIGFRGRKLVKLFVVFMNQQRHNGNREYCSSVYMQPPNVLTASIKQGDRDPLQLAPNLLRSPSTSLLHKLYFDLLMNTQVLGAETKRNTISFEKFKKNAFVMSLNCVAGGTLQTDQLPLIRQGPIHLDLLLEEPLNEALYVYYLGYTVSVLSVAPGQPALLSDELSYERN